MPLPDLSKEGYGISPIAPGKLRRESWMSRLIVDISTFNVLQLEKTPNVGEAQPFNGRFALPVPDGAAVTVDSTSYVLPQDSGSMSALMAQALLAQYPMYSHITWNYLLEDADIADLDLSATPGVAPLGGATPITRVQTGRGAGPAPVGAAPCRTALLPVNDRVGTVQPGMLITNTIDITAVTGGLGTDEVLLWWHLFEFSTTQDINGNYGLYNGVNTPSINNISETDPEPAGLAVYVSNDDGVTWFPIARLEPTDLVAFGTSLRVGFVNTSSNKIYLAAYAILF